MPTLFSGTSGFAYPSWKPDFYPEKLPSKKFLSYYATRLNAVEVNYTFRRLPSASTLENWVNDTRAGFVFPLKAHMRITHILRLKPSDFTEVFFRAIDPLRTARRLGPVLFQLGPALKCDEALLSDFLATLPRDIRCAFEFRHASWLTDSVYGLLEKHGVALCLAESEKLVIPKVITSGFVYSRLRMPEYSAEDRKEIANRVQQLLRQVEQLQFRCGGHWRCLLRDMGRSSPARRLQQAARECQRPRENGSNSIDCPTMSRMRPRGSRIGVTFSSFTDEPPGERRA